MKTRCLFSVTKNRKNMKTYSIRVDKELAEKISRFARIDDRSDAAVIRKALKEFFFKREGVTKKALKKKISISKDHNNENQN